MPRASVTRWVDRGIAMKKAVVFGAGDVGQILYSHIKDTHNVLFFVDNNYKAISIRDIDVLSPSALADEEFDLVYVASAAGLESIYKQLTEDMGIPAGKINRLYSDFWQPSNKAYIERGFETRIKFLEEFGVYAYDHSIEGSVAEVGVFRGDFAKEINRVFSDSRFYLFDTFEGFDERDLEVDSENNQNYHLLGDWLVKEDQFRNSSIETVRNILPNPEKCIIKKGFFPETFNIIDERFVFVNLDADLYQPIKAGLEIFYPLMSRGGVILVHDYFGMLSGVTKAVDEFTRINNLTAIPIGDYLSIAIVKQ